MNVIPERFIGVEEKVAKCDLCKKDAPYCYHFKGGLNCDLYICTPCMQSREESEGARQVCLNSKSKKKR